MKIKLADAIESISLHAHSTHKLRDWQPELSLLIAAGRAFTCNECGGKGKVLIANADTHVSCRACLSSRTVLKEGVES